MKFHTDRVDIERSGVGTESAFKIKTTAKAFDILSSGLYTDNVQACVRELSCNAYDSHIAAGREDVPFEVHLPNTLEPFFAVKDFGVGLSDEDVMKLYTTYFESTKSDSNDFIGALGLGSKSPFSYVKAYEVISRFDSMRRVYSIFINEDGVPTIARLGEAIPTDEHNGIEVKMTVEPGDFHKFKDRASYVLRWFPTPPKVIGEPYFSFQDLPETDMKGDGWMVSRGRSYGGGNIHAIQGYVDYRVNLDAIENLKPSTRVFLQKVDVIAWFDIGDLEVAASREEIRYDNRTQEALLKKIEDIHAAVLQTIEDKADEFDVNKLWDAFIELDKMSQSMFSNSALLREFVAGSEHPILKAYGESQGRFSYGQLSGHHVFMYTWGRHSGRNKNMTRTTAPQHLAYESSTTVFINDMKTGGVSRLSNFMRHKAGLSRVFVIVEKKDPFKYTTTPVDGVDTQVKTAMTPVEVAAERAKLIKDIGNPTVRIVSQDTEAPQKQQRTRTSAVFKYDGCTDNSYNYRRSVVRWDRVNEVDMEEGGLYFKLERGKTIKFQNKKVAWDATDVSDNLEAFVDVANAQLGLEDDAAHEFDDLLGVGALDIKAFDKHEKWFNIFDLVVQAIPEYRQYAELSAKMRRTSDVYCLKEVVTKAEFKKHVDKLSPNSIFRRIVEQLQEGHRLTRESRKLHSAAVRTFDEQYGGLQLDTVDTDVYFEESELDVYPMLWFVGEIELGSWRPTNLDVLFDYINMIDRS